MSNIIIVFILCLYENQSTGKLFHISANDQKTKKIEFLRFLWETCLDISQKESKDFSQRLVALKGFTMLWLKKKEQRLKVKTDTIG